MAHAAPATARGDHERERSERREPVINERYLGGAVRTGYVETLRLIRLHVEVETSIWKRSHMFAARYDASD